MKYTGTFTRLALIAAVALLATSAAAQVTALAPDRTLPTASSEVRDDTPSNWFVELASAPVADGGTASATRSDKQAFRTAAKKAGLKYTERYAFDTLWNGLSIRIAKSDLGKLARIDGIRNIFPVEVLTLPPTQPSDPQLATAVTMTGADIAWTELGLSGAGVKVGVIDAGIDFDHPDFGGDGVPGDGVNSDANFGPDGNSRVKYGWDFVGDDYNAADNAHLTPVPDSNPDSCRDFHGDAGSHGTHVAGIVGASGDPSTGHARGVAPGVTFGAYRVFGCYGSTDSDIMIAAMERALADGMQVVNMSIGSSYQWPQYPTAMAATRLVNRGVTVVCSIGNSGANGAYAASAPGVGEKVIGTASFENLTIKSPALSVNSTLYGYYVAGASPPPPVSGSYPIGRIGTKTTTNAGCTTTLPLPDLTGKVALIRRGTCGFYEKAKNAQNAGAVGVILYNNVPGALNPTVAPVPATAPPVTVPVVALSGTDGNAIDDLLAAGPQNVTWTAETLSAPNSLAGLISDFSSYGLSPDLAVKPDIGAPGGYIRSTYPIEYGSYATISGTSMASPHVAGAVALLLEAKPNTPSQAVRDILMNAAEPKLWSLGPSYGFLDLVHRQGAGMLDIPGAITSPTNVHPAKLSLGESELGPVTKTLTIENHGAADETYVLTWTDAVCSIGTYPVAGDLGFTVGTSLVGFSQNPVTVPAGGSATVDVTIAPDPGLDPTTQYGGYIEFTPQSGADLVRVPFAGMAGDYQLMTVLKPTSNGFPWLAKFNGTSYFNQPGGASYTMAGNDIPFFLAHFDHQSRTVRFEVFDATGKSWHRAFPDILYLGRNSTATSYYAIPWDGWATYGAKRGAKWVTVPNGTYVVKISVLKALGDENNPAHWETWTSPVITLARP